MNKRIVLQLFLSVFVSFSAISAERTTKSLNGEWLFCVDSLNQGYRTFVNGLPGQATKVQVPHTWNVMDGLEEYVGRAWYEYILPIPESYKGKDIRLKFHAIYRDAVIYMNGKKIGEHFSSGYTSFYVKISDAVRYGKDNKLIISVSNEFSEKAIPFGKSFDWTNDGGIIRNVDLIITEKPAIRFAHVNTKNSGEVVLNMKLWDMPSKEFEYKAVVKERGSGKEVAFISKKVGKEQSSTLDFNIPNPKLWHFDHPNIYDLQVSTIQNGKVADTYSTHFGFKEMKVEGEKMYLNGEPVRLIGVEWMPGSNPDFGMAEPRGFIDGILKDMKEVNCVITRFHWQQDEYILDKIDEMGILVQEEIPWWQQPGNHTPETQKIVENQLLEMIEAHYNHPCIFSWGISNEVSTNTMPEQYVSLISYAKQLDSTRFIQMVSDKTPLRREKDESLLGSIPTWNDYTGTWHGESRDDIVPYFQSVKETVGNRPIMITENGLCEPFFKGGDARRIDEMNFHIREWLKYDWVAAAIYFSLNDYRTQRGEEGKGKYKRRTHGISGMKRERKPSFYVLKEFCSPIEILNTLIIDGKNIISLRNKSSLPSYTIEGYKVIFGNKELPLPSLKPGETIDIELPVETKQFSIERTTGYNVLTHKIYE